jgi:hypothetical protein
MAHLGPTSTTLKEIMSNLKFPKLPYLRVIPATFKPLVGCKIPKKSTINSGFVGRHIDAYIKAQMNSPSTPVHSPDLFKHGIEVKSKDTSTSSDWSIGKMRLSDIVKHPYRDSSVFRKLQALLLVTCDDNYREVVDVGLYYFDLDAIQEKLEKTYETIRARLTAITIEHHIHISEMIAKGDFSQIGTMPVFSNSQTFSGNFGKFEFVTGTSFSFRISTGKMKKLCDIAITANSAKNFEFV